MTEEKQQEDSSEKKVSYLERFADERLTWSTIIQEIAHRFKVVEELSDVQIDLYSRRQQAVEYMYQLVTLQSRLKKQNEHEWEKVYIDLSENLDVRYSERERTKLANAKTAKYRLKIEIIQAHQDYFRETVKTIDNMIFGVKHRIEIEEFKSGKK